MASFLIHPGDEPEELLSKIKGAVAAEYIAADETFQESSLNILVAHHDVFEWMDVSLAIPIGSNREYPDPKPEVPKLVSKL